MRLIPPVVVEATARSSAERKVHAALASLTDQPGVAVHSLNLPEHDYKLCAELDFVLVLPEMILVLEVKGGGVRCHHGLWMYRDRYGVDHSSSEGPFLQARSGMFALRDRLTSRLGRRASMFCYGFLVVTPDSDLPLSAEYAVETYVTGTRFRAAGGLSMSLKDTVHYWMGKQRGAPRLTDADRSDVLNYLRPDFDRVPSVATRLDDLDAAFERLTEQQMDRLDLLQENDRVIISGGAGTGKTFLAAETARRAPASTRTVLLCRSGVLAAMLRPRVEADGKRVLTLNDLLKLDDESIDLIIVDEGQDLLNLDAVAQMDRVLAGGLTNGQWRFFHDRNNQAALYDDQDTGAFDLLVTAGVAKASLTRNCRNTREIVFQTRALTGADLGVAAAGEGLPAKFAYLCDGQSETVALEAYLRSLRDDGVPECEVLLVSLRGDWAASSAAGLKLARRGRIQRLDESTATNWPPKQMTWAGVDQAKGFESRFVCVIDMAGLGTARAVAGLYIALSRPRVGLWVSVPSASRPDLENAARSHQDVAMAMLAKRS